MIDEIFILIGVSMRAENLVLKELINFSDGIIDLHGRRLIVHDLYALGQLQRDLMKMFGPDQAKRVITRFGYFWGQADASAMQRLFQWDSKEELLKAGPKLLTLKGVARIDIQIKQFDEAKEHFWIECEWHESGMAESHVSEMGKSDQPVCWLITGYMSGYSSFCLGKSVYFLENKCNAQGNSFCTATGKDFDSWGKEFTPHLEFYHTEDIHGKIKKLSDKIREMEDKLSLQRKLLERTLSGSTLSNVEIRSLQFQQIMNLANKVARFDSSVLITGETGVGKDLLARHIHKFSPRSKGTFVAINCAALTDTLLESELFGHKAGSFTGATRDKRGLFEEAHNGVIFLDEIGDISPNMQSKLLRVLQEREIMRVGDTRPIKIDFRLISATNKDIEKAVEEGTFREDLYYRLQVIHILIPPLRERREDILPLARRFIEKYAERFGFTNLILDATCIDYLISYGWPGNVRELENAIEHAAIMCAGTVILPEHLPAKITHTVEEDHLLGSTNLSLDEVELEHIRRVLDITNGNREEAARILKIGIATLYRKLAKIKNRP